MATYEKKEGDIAVFLNRKRTDENKQPHYTGEALVNGVKMSVSLWLKQPEDKDAYLSGAIKTWEARDMSPVVDPIQNPRPLPAREPAAQEEQPNTSNDELPF